MEQQCETQFSERTIFAAERFLELSYDEKGEWIRFMDEVLEMRDADLERELLRG